MFWKRYELGTIYEDLEFDEPEHHGKYKSKDFVGGKHRPGFIHAKTIDIPSGFLPWINKQNIDDMLLAEGLEVFIWTYINKKTKRQVHIISKLIEAVSKKWHKEILENKRTLAWEKYLSKHVLEKIKDK
jgi:predicted DNA binding CopG/RHH family protein